jgi:hypothetical protein
LPAALLARLAERHLELDVDIYCVGSAGRPRPLHLPERTASG